MEPQIDEELAAQLKALRQERGLSQDYVARWLGKSKQWLSRIENGKLFLQETEVPLDKLVARLGAITESRKETRIFVRGDRQIAYGKVMEVMGLINLAGYSRVALITELPRKPRKTARAEK